MMSDDDWFSGRCQFTVGGVRFDESIKDTTQFYFDWSLSCLGKLLRAMYWRPLDEANQRCQRYRGMS